MRLIDRDAAKDEGLTRYFTGKPCVRGEVAERRVNGGGCLCVKCKEHRRSSKAQQYQNEPEKFRKVARESAQRVRAADRDKWLKDKREWREANRERLLEKQREHRSANIDADRERKRLYRKKKPEVNLAHGARYRARKARAIPSWDVEFDDFVMREAAILCRARAEATGIKWQIDHMIPLRAEEACGLHVGVNLQVIPAWMNTSKRNRMIYTEPGEWLK